MSPSKVDEQRQSLKLEKNRVGQKIYNTARCVRSIVEVNVQAEAISAEVQFPRHSSKIFTLLQNQCHLPSLSYVLIAVVHINKCF